MITQEQYKKIENALCELKLNNDNVFSFGDGYDKALDDAIEQVKKLTIPDVVGQSEQLSCKNCKYLAQEYDSFCNTCFKYAKHEPAT